MPKRTRPSPPSAHSPLELLLAALDRTREATLVLRPIDGREQEILYLNEAFTTLTGYTAAETLHRAPDFLYDDAIREQIETLVEESLMGGEPLQYDITLRTKDGGETWFEIQIVPLAVESNPRWIGVMRDIADRKRTEKSLLESQMRLNGILNSLSEVVWSLRADQDRFIYLSPSAARIFGRPVDDFYRDAGLWFSMVHPTDRESVVAAMRGAISRGSFEIDYRIIREDGEIRWLRNRGRAILDASGRPLHFDGIADDVTAAKLADQHLERMANFPRFNPNPVYELSADGEVTYANEAAEKLAKSLGFDDPVGILRRSVRILGVQCLSRGQAQLRHAEEYGDRTVSWSLFPIPDARVVHVYAWEITDRLRLEQQLRQSEKLKSIGQLAGGVAHDFNNILTVIHGFTSLLLDQHPDNATGEQLQQIATAAERARDLTQQLLMFSRRQVMKPVILDLNQILRELGRMLTRLVGEQIELKVECEESGEEMPVHGDRSMIEQIILNLVANARDALAPGGAVSLSTEAITISAGDPLHPDGRPGEFVRLTARDNGCGMDEETLTRIFEPFFTTKEMGKGTGLGLSTVYGAVQQHEGWVEVESALGVGTVFHIFLPRSHASSRHTAKSAAPEETVGGRETILVVEDEPAVRHLVGTILRTAGYTVIEAIHGADAIEIWAREKERISLVLTDLIMPGKISGVDLADRFSQEKPEIKILFTSGYSGDIMGEESARQNQHRFLPKPYTPNVLLKMVRTALDRKSE